MAKTVTVTVRVNSVGDGHSHSDIFTFTNTNAPAAFYGQQSAGLNSYASGTFGDGGMNGGVLIPPNSQSGNPQPSTIGKTLKGASGDVGVPLDPAGVTALSVVPGGGGIGIFYASPEALEIVFF